MVRPSETRRNTLFGLAAILLWSTTIALSRSLTEQLGTLTAAAFIYTLAGMFGLLFTALQPGGMKSFRQLPLRYLIGCGALFVIYITALYLAVGLAATREEVLIIGLINYLWPALSLVFSIPILKRKAKPSLVLGILLALGGVWLATSSGSQVSLQTLLHSPQDLRSYGLALIAAICWGLYSTLSRRWAEENDAGAVPLFLLASGLLLGVLRTFVDENSQWTSLASLELAYMAIFPGMLAYLLWDIAVRKGEIILVASLSYLTPLLSTLISALLLAVQTGPALWLGAGLVIAGAVLCNISLSKPSTG